MHLNSTHLFLIDDVMVTKGLRPRLGVVCAEADRHSRGQLPGVSWIEETLAKLGRSFRPQGRSGYRRPASVNELCGGTLLAREAVL